MDGQQKKKGENFLSHPVGKFFSPLFLPELIKLKAVFFFLKIEEEIPSHINQWE